MKYFYVLLLIIMGCNAAEHLQISWGMAARKGDRLSMEDMHIHSFPFNDNAHKALFGIFDGHRGNDAARVAAKYFPLLLKEDTGNVFEDLKRVCDSTDKKISEKYCSGTCVLAAYMVNRLLHIAWVGDSRAVLLRNGSLFFETRDHSLANELEVKRITDAGGTIDFIGRIEGKIGVPRALGNAFPVLKHLVIPEPELYVQAIKPGDKLILACDGIWDVFKSQEAVNFVQQMTLKSIDEINNAYPKETQSRNQFDEFLEEGNDEHLTLIARALRDEAYNKESGDNLSVQIIEFK